MIFCAKNKSCNNQDTSITVDNHVIERVEKTKFLGVFIDQKMNWSEHINYTAGKVSRNIGIILKARKFVTKKSLLGLYYTFIYPYLNYCCTVWGNAASSFITRLHVLQKRIVRIISGKPKLTPSLNLFKNLRILPIQQLTKFKLSIFCAKQKLNKLPPALDNFLYNVSGIHTYDTKSSHDYYVVTPRTQYALLSVRYQAPITWNNLHPTLKRFTISSSSENPVISSSFKSNLIDHLLSII